MTTKLSEKQHVLKRLELKVGDRIVWSLSGQSAIVLDVGPSRDRKYHIELIWEPFTNPTPVYPITGPAIPQFREFHIHEIVLHQIQLTLEEKLTHRCEQVRLAAANPDGVKYDATSYRRRARASVGL